MRRQRTTSNHGMIVAVNRLEEDLTHLVTEQERIDYCASVNGKLRNDVCEYATKDSINFMFDYVQKKGQILEISGVSTTSSDTIIKTDFDGYEFKKNDDVWNEYGVKLGKIKDYEKKPIHQKGNRRRQPYHLWFITLS